MAQQVQTKTKRVRAAPAPKVEEAKSVKEMTVAEPVAMHTGKTPSSFRVGKKLTPLRHDYRCGQMSEKDDGFLRDCLGFADEKGQFPRLNADAGRLGRLYKLEFVKYDEIGICDRQQIITLTAKAKDYIKAVTATPKDATKAA